MPAIIKEISKKAIVIMITYECNIWYKGTMKQNIKLLHIQRRLLLYIIKCYSTVATGSLWVLSRCTPLNLIVDLEKQLYNKYRWYYRIKIKQILMWDELESGRYCHHFWNYEFIFHWQKIC